MINLKVLGAAALLVAVPVLTASTVDARPGGRGGGGGFSGFHGGGGGGGFRGGMGGGGFRGGMAGGGFRGGMAPGGFRGGMSAGGFRGANFAARPGGFSTVPRVGNVGAFAGGAALAGRPAFAGQGQRWANANWNRGNWNRGYWNNGRWRNRYWPGYGVAAGLAAGAIGSSYYYGSDPYYYDNYDSYAYDTGGNYDDGQYVAVAPGGGDDAGYCAQRYRSYDPSSGTYLGYDGLRHPCP